METHLHISSSSGTTLEIPSWVWGLTKSFRAWQYVVKRLCCFQRPKTCRDDSKWRHLQSRAWVLSFGWLGAVGSFLTCSTWEEKYGSPFSSSLSLVFSKAWQRLKWWNGRPCHGCSTWRNSWTSARCTWGIDASSFGEVAEAIRSVMLNLWLESDSSCTGLQVALRCSIRFFLPVKRRGSRGKAPWFIALHPRHSGPWHTALFKPLSMKRRSSMVK